MTTPKDDFFELQHRVKRLEKKQKKYEDEELRWALAQFDYKGKTADESKA